MDFKDQKILAELVQNSRIPLSRLAKRVHLSREVALYRLRKLVKEQVILGFYTLINTEKLGYLRFTCFFQLTGISTAQENKFSTFLFHHPFVAYLGPVIGKWNFVFDLFARDKNHLNNLVQEITDYIQPYIESYKVIPTASEQLYFPTKIVGIKKETTFTKPTQDILLDKKDFFLLHLLSTNARTEYVELAKKIGLTPNAIKYRLKKLEKSGIIQGYTLSLDLRLLGYEWYNLQVKLLGNAKEKSLQQFLKQHMEVLYYYKYLHNKSWDFDIGIIVKNSLELRDFTRELKEIFGDVLTIHDSYAVVEELKGNYAPAGIFAR